MSFNSIDGFRISQEIPGDFASLWHKSKAQRRSSKSRGAIPRNARFDATNLPVVQRAVRYRFRNTKKALTGRTL